MGNPTEANMTDTAARPTLALKTIAIAVRFACQQIGQNWRTQQGARHVR